MEYPCTLPASDHTVSLRRPNRVDQRGFQWLNNSAYVPSRVRRPLLILIKVLGPIMGAIPATGGHQSSRRKRCSSLPARKVWRAESADS